MTMARQIATFLEAQAAERNAAANTQAAYARDLKDFADWLGGEALAFETVLRADIERYLVHCDARGLAVATRARRLAAIRQLCRFMFEEGWRADDPAIDISGPGRPRRLPGTLDLAEVERMLDAAQSHGRTEADRLRNTCLMTLLYATGMRVSELVSLPVASARGDPRMILVRGKGGRERMVPLSPAARIALAAWLAVRGAPPSKFLFPSHGRAGHLTRHWFYLFVKELAVQAGIRAERVTPHTLRHAFATHLLAGGADLITIQTLLGHADVGSTEIYTHVLDAHLRELVLEHHPLAKREGEGRTCAGADPAP